MIVVIVLSPFASGFSEAQRKTGPLVGQPETRGLSKSFKIQVQIFQESLEKISESNLEVWHEWVDKIKEGGNEPSLSRLILTPVKEHV